MLREVHLGWKVVQEILNGIIQAVNTNVPVEGDGIRIEDGVSGKIISVARNSQSTSQEGVTQPPVGGGGTQGVLIEIQAIDPVTKNIVTLNVLSDGNGFITSENDWVNVNTVDPASCQATQLTLLKKPTA